MALTLSASQQLKEATAARERAELILELVKYGYVFVDHRHVTQLTDKGWSALKTAMDDASTPDVFPCPTCGAADATEAGCQVCGDGPNG